MAHRRCLHALSRQAAAIFSLKTPQPSLSNLISFKIITRTQHQSDISSKFGTSWSTPWSYSRHFCSNKNGDDDDDDDDEDEDEDYETEASSGEEEDDNTVPQLQRQYTVEEKEAEAAEIGYKLVGPLQKSDRVFKPYEPVFAIVQVLFCDVWSSRCVYMYGTIYILLNM